MENDTPPSGFEIRPIVFTEYYRYTETLAIEEKEPIEKDLKIYIYKYKTKDKQIGNSRNALDIIPIKVNNKYFILKLFKEEKKYLQEKDIYFLLKNENFLPKLVYFDDKNFILCLNHVGDCLEIYKKKNNKKYYKFLHKIKKEIERITNYLYDNYYLYHNDLREKNICIDKNYIIRLIDFEYASSKLRSGEKKGSIKPYP